MNMKRLGDFARIPRRVRCERDTALPRESDELVPQHRQALMERDHWKLACMALRDGLPLPLPGHVGTPETRP